MEQIWISSDTHFGHQREFLWKPRGFSSIEEHDETIIKNWNELIKDNWTKAFLLGDCILNDTSKGLEKLRALNGYITIIAGNHDSPERIELYKKLPNIAGVEYGMPLTYKKFHFFLSHYPTITYNIDDDKQPWQITYNICGHSHTQDKWLHWDVFRCYHVEMDAQNCKPVTIERILMDIKERNKL